MPLRDEIRQYAIATPPAPLPVPTPDLPAWDGQVFVRRVSTGVIQHYYENVTRDKGLDGRAALVALLACDAAGNRIFTDDDVLWLSTSAALGPTLERLYQAGCYHNGLTEENREGWRKNSKGTGGDGSPSSSPDPSTQASVSTSTDS
jgi:hypothetical protein